MPHSTASGTAAFPAAAWPSRLLASQVSFKRTGLAPPRNEGSVEATIRPWPAPRDARARAEARRSPRLRAARAPRRAARAEHLHLDVPRHGRPRARARAHHAAPARPGPARPLAAQAPGRGRAARARGPRRARARRRTSSRSSSWASCAAAPLEPAAVLRTRREGVRARENGRLVADVTVDTVTVLDGRRVRERFVELEVEALEGGADALPGLERAAPRRRRGAERRAAEGVQGARVLPGRAGDPAALGAAARARARDDRAQAGELISHDPGTRLGEDPEELHQARVATRRLRAVLRAGLAAPRPGVDRSPCAPSWPGSAARSGRSATSTSSWSGSARTSATWSPTSAERRRGFPALLEEERAAARESMLAAMSTPRYAELLTPARGGGGRAARHGAADVSLRDIAGRRVPQAPQGRPQASRRPDRRRAPRGPHPREAGALRGRARRGDGRQAGGALRPGRQAAPGRHRRPPGRRRRRGARSLAPRPGRGRAGTLRRRPDRRARARAAPAQARAAFPAAWARLEKSGKRAWS